ncbi:MAG TPA: hypothetical protein VH280_14725, partial [Verrucomicrobiae bacterium]|nr:hypothetical protein [Verrucomicrobiae bacterium]
AFHIVFVAASILLAFGCGVLLLHDYAASHDRPELVLGVLFLIAGVGLLYYGKTVLRKLKHISYL